MKNAQKMFTELGFELYSSTKSVMLYKYATDYEEIVVFFDLENRTYYASYSRWVDNSERTFVPMSERPQNTKHSAYYGHWQTESWHNVDIEQHNAIHQQMIELGWIK